MTEVNVRDFGAIGRVLTTPGDIRAHTMNLTVDDIEGWVIGAGVGIPGAALDGTALVTRVKSIWGNVLTLLDMAQHDALRVTITNDERPPIQAAIDYMGAEGGRVEFPAGMYIIGTPGSSANQPLVLGTNVHLIGAGIGVTILQLCREVNMLRQVDSDSRTSPCTNWACCMFVNHGNPWWFSPQTLPWDNNIEIEKMTFDGNKNHQTQFYEPRYWPRPTQMHHITEDYGAPLTSSWGGVRAVGVVGGLPQGTYDVWVRFQDANGNEGIPFLPTSPRQTLEVGNNAISVRVPPVPPVGAVAVVPYIARADFYVNEDSPGADSEANELDKCLNLRYERLNPIALADIPSWDGNPNESLWPRIQITSHKHYDQGEIDTRGNFRMPGRVLLPGDPRASTFCHFYQVDNLNVHDVEVRDFAHDGVMMWDITNSKFENMHVHRNGRWGISITSNNLQNVDFNDCVIELNETAVDMEAFCGSGLRWNRCSFLNQPGGVSIGAIGPYSSDDLEFNKCIFDGSYGFHISLTNNGAMDVTDVKIKDCIFRNNYNACIKIVSDGTKKVSGEISGCKFEEATGRAREFKPLYDLGAHDSAMISLQGALTSFSITSNVFEPWFYHTPAITGYQEYYSTYPAIDVGNARTAPPVLRIGHTTISNNQFHSNPGDYRAEPVVGVSNINYNVKNRVFIMVNAMPLDNLGQCTISGNTGDGIIYVDGVARYNNNPP